MDLESIQSFVTSICQFVCDESGLTILQLLISIISGLLGGIGGSIIYKQKKKKKIFVMIIPPQYMLIIL